MTDDTRFIVSGVLAVAGLGWWLGVEIWRGGSQDHSTRMFWLHLTSPFVAIAFLATAFCLIFGSDKFRHGL